jgi:hypothetical protein
MALNIYKLTPGDSETPTFSSVERTCPDTPNRKYVEIVPTGNIPTKLKKLEVGWDGVAIIKKCRDICPVGVVGIFQVAIFCRYVVYVLIKG